MLKIDNLTIKVEENTILDNFNLEINDGEIVLLMGKNGTGKSTISKVLLRDNTYQVTKGSIVFNNQDLLSLDTTNVARLGFYLVNQNPVEIDGISNAEVLRCALNEQGKNINILELNKKLKNYCEKLNIDNSFIHRSINYNMSGGEKKKMEAIHLAVLEPKFIILDEIDSGLDVDSLKLVANFLKEYYLNFKPSILIITHQITLLNILKPNSVYVLEDKKIKEKGNFSLAEKIFKQGFSRESLIAKDKENE